VSALLNKKFWKQLIHLLSLQKTLFELGLI
jgi:hypothetical protein